MLSFLNLVVIVLPSTSEFGLATFQVLSTHGYQAVAVSVQLRYSMFIQSSVLTSYGVAWIIIIISILSINYLRSERWGDIDLRSHRRSVARRDSNPAGWLQSLCTCPLWSTVTACRAGTGTCKVSLLGGTRPWGALKTRGFGCSPSRAPETASMKELCLPQ